MKSHLYEMQANLQRQKVDKGFLEQEGTEQGGRKEWTVKEHQESFRDDPLQILFMVMVSQVFTTVETPGCWARPTSWIEVSSARWQRSSGGAAIQVRRVAF